MLWEQVRHYLTKSSSRQDLPTDYFESIGNRVLTIDDIGSLMTNQS